MFDFLHNPPLNRELINMLGGDRVNMLSITPNAQQKSKKDNQALSETLHCVISRPFSFSLESFSFLLSLCEAYGRVGVIASANKMLYEASRAHNNCIQIIPNIDNGSVESGVREALSNGVKCFFVPYLNEDILTSNLYLDEMLHSCFSVWDISYALALNLPLPKNANFMLINGENLGILRGYGILCSKKSDFFGLSALSMYLEIENLYEVFIKAISLKQECSGIDYACRFFEHIKEILHDDVYRFYNTPKNTLPLGLVSSRARNLIQSLLFDDISLINGVDCLYGFSSPSFVLQLMGFSEDRARELLCLSFNNQNIDDTTIKESAIKIANNYLQLKKLQG